MVAISRMNHGHQYPWKTFLPKPSVKRRAQNNKRPLRVPASAVALTLLKRRPPVGLQRRRIQGGTVDSSPTVASHMVMGRAKIIRRTDIKPGGVKTDASCISLAPGDHPLAFRMLSLELRLSSIQLIPKLSDWYQLNTACCSFNPVRQSALRRRPEEPCVVYLSQQPSLSIILISHLREDVEPPTFSASRCKTPSTAIFITHQL